MNDVNVAAAGQEDAVEYANCVRYGLAGSIWTTDLTTAHRVAARVECGIMWINCWLHRCCALVCIYIYVCVCV